MITLDKKRRQRRNGLRNGMLRRALCCIIAGTYLGMLGEELVHVVRNTLEVLV